MTKAKFIYIEGYGLMMRIEDFNAFMGSGVKFIRKPEGKNIRDYEKGRGLISAMRQRNEFILSN